MQPSDSPVHLRGDLDTSSVGDALQLLTDAIAAATGRVVMIDLAEVTFADSSALGMLLDAKERAESQGHALMLINVPKQLQRVLEITKLDEVFETEGGTDIAGEASESA
jgi:anti-anti-sigma factor